MRFNAFGDASMFGGFGAAKRSRRSSKARKASSGAKMRDGQCKCIRTSTGSRKLCKKGGRVKFVRGGC